MATKPLPTRVPKPIVKYKHQGPSDRPTVPSVLRTKGLHTEQTRKLLQLIAQRDNK